MGDLDWTYPEPDGFGANGLDDYDRYVMELCYDGRVLLHQDQGVMVRAVMPVSLDSGQPAALGVWVILNRHDHDLVFERLEADWGGFTFRGFLLNAVEPWPEVFGAPVVLEPANGSVLARVIGTEHDVLQRVLAGDERVRLPGSGH